MTSARSAWPVLRWFRAWPLSAQIILALAAALLPLGVLALIAAFDSYQDVQASRARLAETRLDAVQRGLEAGLDQEFAILQALLLDDVSMPEARAACDSQLTRIARIDTRVESIVRVDAGGRLLCASAGARLPQVPISQLAPAPPVGWGRFSRATLMDEGGGARDLVLTVRDTATEGLGQAILARIPRPAIAGLLPADTHRDGEFVQLSRHGEVLASWGQPIGNAASILHSRRQLHLPDLRLDVELRAGSIQFAQILAIVLPALMWIAAVLIGWLAIGRLVVDPLQTVRGTMDRYAGGETGIRVGKDRFATQEITQLGAAFDRMADEIHGHEGELRDSLATQKKLTREVHHRVKNNLQIVSSLLSLQSRDAPSPDVAYAYATIQKRVNALALVHRWLYDDEAMKGVDLRSLMQDLCAGLEQSAAATEGAQIALMPDVERLRVPQDTAVPLAFLVTELATAAARLADGGAVPVRVLARAGDGRGTLSVESPVFRGEDHFAPASGDAAARIAQGMARQMRTKLSHDPARGSYSVEFPTM